MLFVSVFIAALSMVQEVRAKPVVYIETDEDHAPIPPMITSPPRQYGFWATPAINLDEYALLSGIPRVGRRQVKSNPADLLAACGTGYVDCGGDYCCASGNTCFTDTLTSQIKCNPLTTGFSGLGGLGDLGSFQTTNINELISEYNSVLSQYSQYLSGYHFPTIATTGSFDYNSFISSYYAALGGLTASATVSGNLFNTGLFAPATNTAGATAGAGVGTVATSGDQNNSSGESNGGKVTKKEKKSNLGPIIGGVVGGVVVLALIAGIIIFFVLKNKKKNAKKNTEGAAVVGAGSDSPPSSAEAVKPSAYTQQASVPPTPGQGQPPMGQPMGPPPMGQYPSPISSPPPPSVSPIGVMGGLPAVPQPGQYQQSPSPSSQSQSQYGQYAQPPPAFSPPPPSASPVPFVAGAAIPSEPGKGYFSPPPGQQYAEMPGQQPYIPQPQGQQPQQVQYPEGQQPHQQPQPYQQVPSAGPPHSQPPFYGGQQQFQQGPIAEMDATGGR